MMRGGEPGPQAHITMSHLTQAELDQRAKEAAAARAAGFTEAELKAERARLGYSLNAAGETIDENGKVVADFPAPRP